MIRNVSQWNIQRFTNANHFPQNPSSLRRNYVTQVHPHTFRHTHIHTMHIHTLIYTQHTHTLIYTQRTHTHTLIYTQRTHTHSYTRTHTLIYTQRTHTTFTHAIQCTMYVHICIHMYVQWASLVTTGFPSGSAVKNPPVMHKLTTVFLPKESPWTKESGKLQSIGLQRVGHD